MRTISKARILMLLGFPITITLLPILARLPDPFPQFFVLLGASLAAFGIMLPAVVDLYNRDIKHQDTDTFWAPRRRQDKKDE